ncbi:hypothetical protein [uncultured Gilliamella sp.]|nr:hypothetical protein [uncultured Gilliamella sp.]
MSAEEQDEYFLDILNALHQAEKSGAIEIPKEVCESDKAMFDWINSL